MDSTRLARILAAMNGSEAGRHAARLAQALAEETGAKLRLLSVETTGIPGYASDGVSGKTQESPTEIDWSRGVPGIEIVRAAETWSADLVVLGRRQRSSDDGGLLGRTVDTVIRRRSGPSLLIPREVCKLHRMLLALDGTDRGLGILPFAEMFAKTFDLPASSVFSAPEPDSAHTAKPKLLTALLEHPALGGPDHLEVRFGSPVEEILAAAAASKADLLVVGVRRGGPLGDAGSGHVGKDLLLKAPTAILTVPI